MFDLIYKPTEQRTTIYNIKTNQSGYPVFLVYLDKQWQWKSAKHFKPEENVCEDVDWLYK